MKKKNLLNTKKAILALSIMLSTFNSNILNSKANEAELPANIEVQDINDINIDKFKTTDYYIKHYSKIFGLNDEIIHDKIYELADNFNSENYGWKYAYALDGETYDNKETAIMKTVYKIWSNPSAYNFTDDERNNLYKSYNINESNIKEEELIAKYSEVFKVNKEVALAIAYYESYYFTSSNYYNNNNPAGLGPHDYFPSKEAGIIEYCSRLNYLYGCRENSNENYLFSIQNSYCSPVYDEDGNQINNWYTPVSSIYFNLKYDYLYRIPEEEKENYDIKGYTNPNIKEESKNIYKIKMYS